MAMGKKRVPVIIEGVMHFTCTQCQQLKPADLMLKDSHCSYGVSSHCKSCHSLADMKSKAKKPEYYAAYKKQWWKNNPNYQKQRHENNPDYRANYCANRRANDPIFKFKENIRNLTRYAILRGELSKSNACAHCYSSQNIEAHHWEYSLEKALEVIWLCRNCHDALHASLSEQPKVILPINFVIEE